MLVRKFAWLACSDGIALMIRNSPIRAIAPMMVAPAAIAMDLKTVSPQRSVASLQGRSRPGLVGIFEECPDLLWARRSLPTSPRGRIWCHSHSSPAD